jgi:hypothetical protein
MPVADLEAHDPIDNRGEHDREERADVYEFKHVEQTPAQVDGQKDGYGKENAALYGVFKTFGLWVFEVQGRAPWCCNTIMMRKPTAGLSGSASGSVI